MIRFRAPKLARMANGQKCIELTDDGSWESFPRFAVALAKEIGADIIERVDGPDVRVWILRVGGHELSLVYDDFPNGISLEPRDGASTTVIEQLYARFLEESAKGGI